jgi:hypothetical protein
LFLEILWITSFYINHFACKDLKLGLKIPHWPWTMNLFFVLWSLKCDSTQGIYALTILAKKSFGIYEHFFSIKMPRRCMCGSQILVVYTRVFKQPKTCLHVVIHEWFHFQLKHTNQQFWVINYMLTSINSLMISC